jgi:OmpA-OmpF porin, OOP family
MALNLLELIKGSISSDLVSKAASMLGENGDSVQKAMSGSVPTILSGMMSKLTDGSKADGLLNIIRSEDGGNIIASLFGDKANAASAAIAAHAGIKSENASKVLSMAAPLVSGSVGKALAGAGGLAGIAGLLFSNLDGIKAALPSGILDKIGISSLDQMADKAKGIFGASVLSGTGISAAAESHSAGHGHGHHHGDDKKVAIAPFAKIFPWVAGLTVVALAWFLMGRGNQAASHNEHDTHATAHDTAHQSGHTNEMKVEVKDTVPTPEPGVLGAKYKVKIASGSELDIPANGIEDRMIKFIEDKNQIADKNIWFNFDRINFATGSADLTKESMEQVDNMVQILKAYPKVTFKIGGHTDNKGVKEANLTLSTKRAEAVMNAIVKGGIDGARLKAEGYGDQFPEASNDTEEGRAKNRRIAVAIRNK